MESRQIEIWRGLISLGLSDFEEYTAQIKSKWLQFDLLHFENKVKMESHFPSLDQIFYGTNNTTEQL